jgi:multidrug efflux pump subunit AcrA (membrane-fusion protein)
VKTDLFHIAQDGQLRVYVNVPEEYSQEIGDGMTADLSLAEFPGRSFQGRLVRTADAINMTTRTLLVEIDVDNPGVLLSGARAESPDCSADIAGEYQGKLSCFTEARGREAPHGMDCNAAGRFTRSPRFPASSRCGT